MPNLESALAAILNDDANEAEVPYFINQAMARLNDIEVDVADE